MAGPTQARVQLHTKEAALELPEKTGPLLVSTNLTRHAFSQLINQLLSTSIEKPIPLEILVNGSFLRSDLGSFLQNNGLSTEGILSVEYTRALLPHTYRSSFQHDDWVGSVDVLSSTSYAGHDRVREGNPRILTGSFDGLLRVWNASGNTTATSSLCSALPCQSIYSSKWLSQNRIASAGFGVPIRLWSYDESGYGNEDPTPNATADLTPQLDLYAHRDSGASNSLAFHAGTSQILSAGDDGRLALFSSSSDPADHGTLPSFIKSSGPASKKRRLSSTKVNAAPKAGPLSIITPSTGNLTSEPTILRPLTDCIFHPKDPSAAYTTSRDRTLRTLDLTTSATVSTHTPQRDSALTCLTSLPSLGLIATGTSTASISLVDPRASGNTTEVARLTGFKNEVRSVCTAPNSDGGSAYQLAGAAFDGTVRIFDVRDSRGALSADTDGADDGPVGGAKRIKPIYRIARRGNEKCDRVVGGEGVKLFGMCWDAEVGLCSAGEDKTVQVNRAG